MRRRIVVLLLALVAGAGCSHDDAAPTPPASSASVGVIDGSDGCAAVSSAADALREVAGGSPDEVSLFGLLFTAYPIPAGAEAKIAWRMTGSGDLTLHATGPDGSRIEPDWGPEQHAGSSWDRPGEEWGSGFTFPTAGCWTVHAARGTAEATASLLVE